MKPELWIPLMSFAGTLTVLVVASVYNNARLTDFQRAVGETVRLQNEKFDSIIHSHNEKFDSIIRSESDKHEANIRRVEDLLLHKVPGTGHTPEPDRIAPEHVKLLRATIP